MSIAVEPLVFLAGVNTFGTSDEGWSLSTPPEDEQPRVFRSPVFFNQSFRTGPVVHLGVAGFDVSNHDAARLKVRAENISIEGFEVVLETWLNSKIWSVDVSWLAVGG